MAQYREELPGDAAAVRALQRAAFASDVEPALVDRLRAEGFVLVSMVAVEEERVVGHILFSRVRIETGGGGVDVVALAPVAVLPEWQRRGIGSELIRRGLDACRARGERIVFVLGDPAYYGRFGFRAEPARAFECPWSGEAFQVVELTAGALLGLSGMLRYPPPFAGLE